MNGREKPIMLEISVKFHGAIDRSRARLEEANASDIVGDLYLLTESKQTNARIFIILEHVNWLRTTEEK